MEIPKVGFGTFQLPNDTTTTEIVRYAIEEAGYRHIDTAQAYGNEEAVGMAIKESGIPREEIFITTKLWNDDIRKHRTKEALQESLHKLQVEYVDLYLIHWPAEGYVAAYLQMEQLKKEGLVKSIGVSNFRKSHLQNLLPIKLRL